MRLLVALGLVATALAALRAPHHDRYIQGKEYIYKWNAQVLSGLPVAGSSQHSIQQIQSNVHFSLDGEHEAVVYLRNIKLINTHKTVEEPRQLKEVRGEETELTSEQKNLLELPIRFRYHNGIVSEIRFSEEENAWTENIKRSVLNLLQINVNKAEENKQFYNVHEKTIEGDCEVTYSFVPRNEKTEVTKTINFEKCEKRMDVRYNYRFSEKTNEFYGQEETLPESQTVITYTLASTPESLMIEEAQLRSEYVFAPLNKEQKMLSTHITAKIVLEKVTEARRIEEPRYTTRRGDLTFNYELELARERFWMTGDDDFWMKAGFDKVPRKVETIEKLIIKLIKTVEHVQDGVELHATHEMARIVEWLRMCNKREIREVHERICINDRVDERTKKVINDLISDALAIAGTHVTIEHLIEKIRKEEISEPKAVLALKNLVNMRTPSREVVEMLLNFLKKDEIRRRPALKQTIMLTWGALINGVCGETKDRLFSEIEEPICTRQLKNDWIREFKRMLEEAEDRYEKVLVLKTMANAGIDTQVHMLEDIIYNKNEETVIRVSAIDALRQLRPKMARKIQNILLPLYKSRSERTHIRMTAVYHLLQTLPERFVIDQVVEQLNKERDQQLFSFTYSLLDGFRRSENPLEKRIARDIEVSLRLLNSNTETYSRHLHMPVYSSLFDMGLSLDFASLFTNESALPQELLASFDTLVSGQWNKQQSQIGLFQTGVDRILMKVVDRLSKTGIKEVVLRGRRASTTQPLHLLRDLVEKMNVQSRKSEETPFAMMYLRYKNLDYAVLPVDEEIVNYITKNVLRDGEINFSEIERLMSQGYRFESQLATYLYEQTRVIPTTIGMPLTITTKMPTVASISGHVKVEVDRKMMTPLVRLVVKPQIAATHVTEMLLITPLSHSGVRMLHSVQMHTPVDMKMEINLGKKLIKTSLIVPETEKRVFLFDSRPVTFVRRISENVPETEEKTVFVQKMQKTNVHYEKSFGNEIFGFDMNVFGSVQKHMFEDNFARAILYGENHIQMSYVPKREAVREFVTEVMLVEEREQDIEGPRYEEESELAYDVEESFEEKKTEKRDYFKSLKTEKAHRYRLVAKAYTVGGPKETKAELTVRQECADNLRYCKWNVICLRSPLFDEKREWEMRAELEAVLPKMPSTLEQLKEQKHREVQLKVNAEWGCEEKNVLKMKVQAEQDKPMREMIKQIRKEERGFLGEEQTLYTVARLNQYRMVVNYDLVPQTERLFSYFKDLFLAKYYWNTEMTPIKGHDGRMIVQLNVEPETRRYVNLTIETAEQRLRLVEVATPIRIPLLNIARPMINKRTLTQSAVCEVSETKIRTFDDLLYKTPLTTCYSVIAKDCSEEPRFAVLMKNVEKNGEEKKVKIVSQDNVIELELIDEEVICRVNKEEVRDDERLSEFGINKINKDLVEVELEYLTVRFDGYTAKVHMSHLMKNKQCGLCGHFDGRADNEFRRPENFEEEDMETFHRSWLSRDSECRMEEDKLTEKKNYRIVEDEFDSEEKDDQIFDLFFGKNQKSERKNLLRKTSLRRNLRSEETYKPEERTFVIEREQKTCFSMEPVAQCENTEEIETSKVEKVRFVCLPKHKPATRRLLNIVRQGELADMTEFEHTQIEKVHVPTLCTVY